jgi:serine protease Do
MMGLGSGFFISSDGYVVTNHHVVKEASSVTVTMDDGKVLDAKVIGADPKTDLALLKVAQAGDYPYVSFSAQDPKVGDWVLAIGEPYGLGGTATAGIISAEGREIGDGPYDRFLQIDAPINKGNSGGPTFDMQGQVVGVNTAIFSPSGGSIGIGFAIPATTASKVVADLEHGGVVERGLLGVQVQSVEPDIAESLGMKTAQGAIVAAVTTDSPAANAGLKQGDVITKVNDEAIKHAGDLTRRIGALKPGSKVTLSFVRDGTEKTAEVTLAAQPTESNAKTEARADEQARPLGLELAPGTQTTKSGERGVGIVNVDPNGAAAAKGVKSGDVLLDVAGKPVSTPEQVVSEIARSKQEHAKAVLMRIQTSDGSDRFVALPFAKA